MSKFTRFDVFNRAQSTYGCQSKSLKPFKSCLRNDPSLKCEVGHETKFTSKISCISDDQEILGSIPIGTIFWLNFTLPCKPLLAILPLYNLGKNLKNIQMQQLCTIAPL